MNKTEYIYLEPVLLGLRDSNDRVNEIFMSNKCQANGTNSKSDFYSWCSTLASTNGTTTFTAKCEGLFEGKVPCVHEFVVKQSTIDETEKCPLGGNKFQSAKFKINLGNGVREDIQSTCYDYLMGRPFPWWAIMLIVLAILIAFSVAAGLFWKYWLKKRWQKPAGSTLESRWTESPVSSVSGISSGAAHPRPPPLLPLSPVSTGRLSRNSRSGSGSRRVSQRSNLSGGRSGTRSGGGRSSSASSQKRASGV